MNGWKPHKTKRLAVNQGLIAVFVDKPGGAVESRIGKTIRMRGKSMRAFVMMAIFAAGNACLLAQSAPVKMGLWEKTMVVSNGDGAPATMKSKSCITPEAWQQMMATVQKPHDGCKMNTVKTGNGYTSNGTCSLPGGTSMAISATETIADSEHIIAESHSTTTTSGKTRKIDSHSTSRFLSTSCGSIKPDDPEIE